LVCISAFISAASRKEEKEMSAIALALSAAITSTTFGAFYAGGGGAIPDATTSNSIPGSGLFSSSVVATEVGTITGIKMVTLNGLAHTFVGDLQVTIISPNGTRVNLFSRFGVTTATGFGSSKDLGGDYSFTDGIGSPAFNPVAGAGLYPSGTYQRITNSVAAVVQVGTTGGVQGLNPNTYATMIGGASNGTWTLEIRDFAAADTGSLASWSIEFNYVPAPGAIALLGLVGVTARRRRA